MSTAFKYNERWRRDEKSTALRFFECRLPTLLNNKHGMTATKLARLLGVSKTAVSHWMSGYSMPPSDIQEKIAYLLGCHSRAEVWVWKGTQLTEYLLKLNQLYSEIEYEEQRIESLLQSEPLTIQKSTV